MSRRILALAAAALPLIAPRASSQTEQTVVSAATGVHVQSLDFGAGSDVSSARLFLVPLAYEAQLSPRVVLDGYAAYASGTVRADNQTFDLRGPVDSWLRVRWAATPWAVLAVGVSIPTGVATHTPSEAVVANVLSSDLLGFREGNWGGGASATAGVSAVRSLGSARATFGLSYRMVGGFDPRTDTSVTYAPGNETRARVGLGWDALGGRIEGGLTAQSFTVDKLNQKNLFQSGRRYRADLSYAIGAWSVYGADLLRDRGELTLPVINVLDGSVLRDTSTSVGWQNLVLGGISGYLPITRSFVVEPLLEAKARQRETQDGRGWLTSAGATVPFGMLGFDVFPTAKVTRGALVPSDASAARNVWGGEFSLVIRRSVARRR